MKWAGVNSNEKKEKKLYVSWIPHTISYETFLHVVRRPSGRKTQQQKNIYKMISKLIVTLEIIHERARESVGLAKKKEAERKKLALLPFHRVFSSRHSNEFRWYNEKYKFRKKYTRDEGKTTSIFTHSISAFLDPPSPRVEWMCCSSANPEMFTVLLFDKLKIASAPLSCNPTSEKKLENFNKPSSSKQVKNVPVPKSSNKLGPVCVCNWELTSHTYSDS